MSRIVVTGGGGFIGSHVVESLCAAGHELLVVDDFSTGDRENLADALVRYPELHIHQADIAEPGTAVRIEHFAPRAMVLLAAQFSVKVSMRAPLFDARVNILGLLQMLEAARRSRCQKVVFASSGGTIYGAGSQETLPTPETCVRVPASFYGLTKSVAIDYLRLYEEIHELQWVALALGNVYGPRQAPSGEAGVVAIFAQRILSGLPCIINGDGRTTRDFVHVTDVADAFVRAVDRGHGLINVASARESSVWEIYETVRAQIGIAASFEHGPPLAGEVRRVCLDIDRAERELGWRPAVELAEGVGSVISWLSMRMRPEGVR